MISATVGKQKSGTVHVRYHRRRSRLLTPGGVAAVSYHEEGKFGCTFPIFRGRFDSLKQISRSSSMCALNPLSICMFWTHVASHSPHRQYRHSPSLLAARRSSHSPSSSNSSTDPNDSSTQFSSWLSPSIVLIFVVVDVRCANVSLTKT